MKKLTILLVVFCAAITVQAQDTDAYVDQYCELVATPRLLSSRVTIDIDYGEERSIWRDNRVREDNGKLKKFNTVIDALNYMGRDGWKLVNAFPVMNGSNNSYSYVYHYVFKKSFPKSEVGN